MKKIYNKQKKIISLLKKNEIKKIFLKKLIYNMNLDRNTRNIAMHELNDISRNASKVRIKNYCYITYKTKGVFRLSNMSRIKFKELILSGCLPGIFIK